MLKTIWKIVNNSFFGLLFGAGLTLFILFLQRQNIEIGYTVLNRNVIAKGNVDKNMVILYKNDTIANLNIMEFAFWNHGTQYIDKKNISETIPLIISANSEVQILDYKIIKKSRNNLNFSMSKNTDVKEPGVVLKLEGDDGLEKFDGIKIQILYSGAENLDWKISGRIKGNLNSFKKFNQTRLEKYGKEPIWRFILYLFGLIIIPVFMFSLGKILKEKKIHEEKAGSAVGLIISLSMFEIICLIHVWNYVFYNGKLEWLLK